MWPLLLLHGLLLLLLLVLLLGRCGLLLAAGGDDIVLASWNVIILNDTAQVCVEFLNFIHVEITVITQTNQHVVDALFEVERAHLVLLF